MKNILRVSIFILLASLASLSFGCAKSEADLPAKAGDRLVPESALLVGSLDVPKLMTISQIKETQAAIEKEIGIKLEKLKELSFWVSFSEDAGQEWCIISAAEAFSESTLALEASGVTVEGVGLYTIEKNDTIRVATVSLQANGAVSGAVAPADADWMLIGSERGIGASIRAAGGANLAQSPRGKEFRQMMAKANGAFTLAFVPTPEITKKIREQRLDQDFDPFIQNFTGAGIALNFSDESIGLALALESSKSAAKAVAESLMKKKEEFKDIVAYSAGMVGLEDVSLLEQSYASFNAKADGATLRLELSIANKLLEGAVKQFSALSGQAGQTEEEEEEEED